MKKLKGVNRNSRYADWECFNCGFVGKQSERGYKCCKKPRIKCIIKRNCQNCARSQPKNVCYIENCVKCLGSKQDHPHWINRQPFQMEEPK